MFEFSMNIACYLFMVILLGYTIQTIFGFGATVFAIPLATFFVDKMLILPVLLLLSIYQSLAVVLKDRRHILKIRFIQMLFLAMAGAFTGIMAGGYFSLNVSNIFLGLFITAHSLHSLWFIFRDRSVTQELKKIHFSYPFLSGFFQSAYGVGGPMIASYMGVVTDNKRSYRGMISLYFFLLNPFIVIGYLFRGEVNMSHVSTLTLLIPAVALGLFAGNRIMDKISKKKFKIFVHVLLIIIAMTLFFR